MAGTKISPNDVKAGAYVRPGHPTDDFPMGLYEVEERTVGGRVRLRDTAVPITPWMADDGVYEATVMMLQKSWLLVEPEPVLLEDLLAA